MIWIIIAIIVVLVIFVIASYNGLVNSPHANQGGVESN